jgi:hypothetical protein
MQRWCGCGPRTDYWPRVVNRVAEVLERAHGRVGATGKAKVHPRDPGGQERDVIERGPGPPSVHQHNLKGLLLVQNPSDVAEAEQCFRTAIEIARRQSARSIELRAATSLARLLAKQGRRDEARAMLAEIYGWFTEGFDTADLKHAKTLLDELSR